MSHVDFVLPFPDGRMAVVGWYDGAAGAVPAASLIVGGAELCKAEAGGNALQFHLREDLKAPARGFLAIFDTVPAGRDRGQIALGDTRIALPAAPATGAWASFAKAAVNGAFVAVMLAHVALSGRFTAGVVQAVATRLRSFGEFAQSPQAALGFDRFEVCPDLRHATVTGWALSSSPEAVDAVLLVLGDSGIEVHDIARNSLLRQDLSGFAAALDYTGADGISAVIELADPLALGPAPQAIVLLRAGLCCLAVGGAGTALAKRSYAAMLMALQPRFLPSPDMPTLLPRLVVPDLSTARDHSGPEPLKPVLHVVLDHDGQTRDLRDVLRHLTHSFDGQLLVSVLIAAACPQAHRSITGAQADPGGARLVDVTTSSQPDWRDLAGRGAPVLYARSSTLVQMPDWGDLFDQAMRGAGQAQVLMEPPFLRGADPGGLAAVFAAEHPAFAVLVPPALTGTLGMLPGIGVLTVEGAMRAMVLGLAEAGQAAFHLTQGPPLFAGRADGTEAPLIAVAFDRAVLDHAQFDRSLS